MIYVAVGPKPTDENLINAVSIEMYLHRKKFLIGIKDSDRFKSEFYRFFKKTCEELRAEFRPHYSQDKFLKKMASDIWEDISEIQAIINIKRYTVEKTKKRTTRRTKGEDKIIGGIPITKKNPPKLYQGSLF